jgi:hypothetical protein
MSLATELRQLVAASGAPVEFAQGSYRLRLMPGVGRIHDVNFSIWEADGSRWEPILAGWVRGEGLVVSTWRAPGSPTNAETLTRFVLAGKRQNPEAASYPGPGASGEQSCLSAVAAP